MDREYVAKLGWRLLRTVIDFNDKHEDLGVDDVMEAFDVAQKTYFIGQIDLHMLGGALGEALEVLYTQETLDEAERIMRDGD